MVWASQNYSDNFFSSLHILFFIMFTLIFREVNGSSGARFEILPFQNKGLEPKGPVQVNGKVTKSAHFLPSLLWEKIGLITFSQFYICLNLARNLHINLKKLRGHSSCFFRKTPNRPKNHHFCNIARYCLQ